MCVEDDSVLVEIESSSTETAAGELIGALSLKELTETV
jgi:hypothetical protein